MIMIAKVGNLPATGPTGRSVANDGSLGCKDEDSAPYGRLSAAPIDDLTTLTCRRATKFDHPPHTTPPTHPRRRRRADDPRGHPALPRARWLPGARSGGRLLGAPSGPGGAAGPDRARLDAPRHRWPDDHSPTPSTP